MSAPGETGGGVRERGIIFSAPMVRALLAGRKTQTRRAPKWQPYAATQSFTLSSMPGIHRHGDVVWPLGPGNTIVSNKPGPHPEWITRHIKYAVSDRLWVREAHQINAFGQHPNWTAEHVIYAADDACVEMRPPVAFVGSCDIGLRSWRSSIHMPRWASRITLAVTDVRVQRLQDISEEDARAEGMADISTPDHRCFGIEDLAAAQSPRRAFWLLWEHIHGPGAWDLNPWVAAISFTVEPNARLHLARATGAEP